MARSAYYADNTHTAIRVRNGTLDHSEVSASIRRRTPTGLDEINIRFKCVALTYWNKYVGAHTAVSCAARHSEKVDRLNSDRTAFCDFGGPREFGLWLSVRRLSTHRYTVSHICSDHSIHSPFPHAFAELFRVEHNGHFVGAISARQKGAGKLRIGVIKRFNDNELGPPWVRQISADVKTDDKAVIYCKKF
jgi:hypothetical protein